MKNGFKILWTDYALEELENTIEYLEGNQTKKELQNLAVNIEKTLILISQNPVEIISFFSNKQNPKKRKLK